MKVKWGVQGQASTSEHEVAATLRTESNFFQPQQRECSAGEAGMLCHGAKHTPGQGLRQTEGGPGGGEAVVPGYYPFPRSARR